MRFLLLLLFSVFFLVDECTNWLTFIHSLINQTTPPGVKEYKYGATAKSSPGCNLAGYTSCIQNSYAFDEVNDEMVSALFLACPSVKLPAATARFVAPTLTPLFGIGKTDKLEAACRAYHRYGSGASDSRDFSLGASAVAFGLAAMVARGGLL